MNIEGGAEASHHSKSVPHSDCVGQLLVDDSDRMTSAEADVTTVIFDAVDIAEWLPTKMIEDLFRIAETYHVSVDEQLKELESPRGDS